MIGGGPSRTPQPTSRRAAYRTEVSNQQVEEPRPVPMEELERPAPLQRQQSAPRYAAPEKKRGFAWLKWLVGALVIVAAAAVIWFIWSGQRNVEATIDSDKYQAVFLSNGQVYFGKLSVVNTEYMQLTNVYYLERQLTAGETAEQADQAATPGDNNFQLLKYSDVLYGSEDMMVISKTDIIRYENLRSDGVVAQAIANRQ